MSWNTHYIPPDKSFWLGRADIPPASCFFQIMKTINLLDDKPSESPLHTFALIGFKCDEGIKRNHGRVGAAEGPPAIRHALAKLPVQTQNFICYDVGNIVCTDGDLEGAQKALGEVIALLLKQKIIPIVLGGGHELAWGHYQGIADVFKETQLGIINFDAHLDMRPLLPNQHGSSGTPFLQIANAHKEANRKLDYHCFGIQHAGNIRQLIDTAKQFNVHIMWADDVHHGQAEKGADFIDRIVDQNEKIYMSLCLDVFASAFAPGVSATQPLGLWPWHVIPLVRQLAASGKVVSYDIAELAPRYDVDHHTAKLAANLVYEIIHHHQDAHHFG